MNQHIKKLVKDNPNDQDLGAAIREYVSSKNTCCDKEIYQSIYIDAKGKEWPQCRKCGTLLI